jgi:SAM-dependent methyltransferase
MERLDRSGPNAEQIKYWNEAAGPKWVAFQAFLDAQLRRFGRAVMDRAGLTGGGRVVDVGCGCGDTTLELARRVGPTGEAVGIDISAVMLERARESAQATGIANVRFEQLDVQTHDVPAPPFDVVYSRFGIMFFSDPLAAFTRLRGALRPGGRLACICWRALAENPWLLVPLMAAAQHVPLPAPPPPEAPGPFSLADPDRVRGILTGAGFRDLAVTPFDEPLTLGTGADLDQTVEFVLQLGPTGALMREASDEVRARVAVAVREAITPYRTSDGVRMPSAAWIVTGSRS